MKKEKEKILIIKSGYTEMLDKEIDSRRTSYGEVLRTTCILYLFKDDYVTWVSDESAFPLLKDNPFINRLLRLDFLTLPQLEQEYFDTVINLEKTAGICAFTRKIDAWKKYGFRFDPRTGEVKAHDKATEVLSLGTDYESKRQNKKTAQELLFEMVGEKWNGEEYILGYTPKSKELYDVGLNTQVGLKWPTKAWSMKKWDDLEERLITAGLKVTRQDKQAKEILENLYSYMDWINSSKMIVSNDSLGLHLGIAMKKKVLGLFGATPHREVHFYGRGEAILPEPVPECLPCFDSECKREKNCIEDISVERIYKSVMKHMNLSI